MAMGAAFGAAAAPQLPTFSKLAAIAPQGISLSDSTVARTPGGTQKSLEAHQGSVPAIDKLIKQTDSAIKAHDPAQAAPTKGKPSVVRQLASAAIGAALLPVGGPLATLLMMQDALKIGSAAQNSLNHDTHSMPKPEYLATSHVKWEKGRRVETFSGISLDLNNTGYVSHAPQPHQSAAPAINFGDVATAGQSLKGTKPKFDPEKAHTIMAGLKVRRAEEERTLGYAASHFGFQVAMPSVTKPAQGLKFPSFGATGSGPKRGLGGLALAM